MRRDLLSTTSLTPPHKGRWRVGEEHGRAKLSDQEVEEIRDLWEARERVPMKVDYPSLMALYGASKSTIHDIVTYRRRVGAMSREHWHLDR